MSFTATFSTDEVCQNKEESCAATTTTATTTTTTTATNGNNNGINTVLVTGSNGFVGSWIVKELLEQGYTVHACVRDANNPQKVIHLLELLHDNDDDRHDRLKLFSTRDLGGADASSTVWDDPLKGGVVDAVIHTSMAMDWNDGLNGMYHPTLEGTQQLLQAIDERHPTLKSFILTSSMAAVATQAAGIITDESHWRNAQDDLNQGSYYSATKIAQEQLVTEWAEQRRKQFSKFQFVAICPTRVLGPPISTKLLIEGWLNQLRYWIQHPPAEENDTMELVHPQDVARLHIAALEKNLNANANEADAEAAAYGRYLCVDESWHWNDFLDFLEQLRPQMPAVSRYQGNEDKMPPKLYNPQKRYSLGVPFRSMKEILQEAVEYLKARGELGDQFATI